MSPRFWQRRKMRYKSIMKVSHYIGTACMCRAPYSNSLTLTAVDWFRYLRPCRGAYSGKIQKREPIRIEWNVTFCDVAVRRSYLCVWHLVPTRVGWLWRCLLQTVSIPTLLTQLPSEVWDSHRGLWRQVQLVRGTCCLHVQGSRGFSLQLRMIRGHFCK
jgi:hypothetical protein